MKNIVFHFLAVLAVLALEPTVQAGLIHSYDFSRDAPLADDAGGLELTVMGDVAFSPEGFATFDGKGSHLYAEALNSANQIYTVSFWISSDNYQPGEEDMAGGILSSTDKNPFAKGNWGVGLRRNVIRFGGKSFDDKLVSQALIEKPEPGMWHLVTLKFNGEEGGGGWVDEGPYVPFAAMKPTEGDPPPSFADIRKLIIGSDHQGKTGFAGDIADVRIYDDFEWDDAKQSAAFQAGPSLGTSAASGVK